MIEKQGDKKERLYQNKMESGGSGSGGVASQGVC